MLPHALSIKATEYVREYKYSNIIAAHKMTLLGKFTVSVKSMILIHTALCNKSK